MVLIAIFSRISKTVKGQATRNLPYLMLVLCFVVDSGIMCCLVDGPGESKATGVNPKEKIRKERP